jgi:hypothetical protein
MVTEVKYECNLCHLKEWGSEIPDECTDCGLDEFTQIDSRERDESNGFCSVGSEDAIVNCELVATHEADIESEYEEKGYITRKVCTEHKNFWEGSPNIIEMRGL